MTYIFYQNLTYLRTINVVIIPDLVISLYCFQYHRRRRWNKRLYCLPHLTPTATSEICIFSVCGIKYTPIAWLPDEAWLSIDNSVRVVKLAPTTKAALSLSTSEETSPTSVVILMPDPLTSTYFFILNYVFYLNRYFN